MHLETLKSGESPTDNQTTPANERTNWFVLLPRISFYLIIIVLSIITLWKIICYGVSLEIVKNLTSNSIHTIQDPKVDYLIKEKLPNFPPIMKVKRQNNKLKYKDKIASTIKQHRNRFFGGKTIYTTNNIKHKSRSLNFKRI